MWNENVCRLCLSNKELFCVFEKRENQVNNLKQIIFITAGVEINENDVVSRKICENCRKVTIKMSEFRERSIKTDKYIKAKYADFMKTRKSDDATKTENDVDEDASKLCHIVEVKITEPLTNVLQTKKKVVDPSISNIFTTYSNIKLPFNVLSCNVDPSVLMELDAVENYFIRNKLDMNKAVQMAFRSKKTLVSDKQTKNDVDTTTVVRISGSESEGSKDDLKRKIKKDNKSEKSCKIKRRRLSSSDFVSDNELSAAPPPPPPPTTPTILNTLGLVQTKIDHKCKVCGSIQSSSVTLNNHVKEHFRCNFCKARFKLVIRKDEHEIDCVVKHILTRKVYVPLRRIDLDKGAVEKYPVLNKIIGHRRSSTSSNIVSCTEEIIELSDSDDDNNDCKLIEKNPTKIATSTVDGPPISIPVPISEPSENYIHYFSTGLVRPDIKVKDDAIFNSVDMTTTDLNVLKQILEKKNATTCVHEHTQTVSISNEDIIKYPNDCVTFKGLKSQLHTFRVPVRVQKGSFGVSYITNTPPSAPKCNMDLWSNANAIGLKRGKSIESPAMLKTNQIQIQLPDLNRIAVQKPTDQIKSNVYKNIRLLKQNPKVSKPAQIIQNQYTTSNISHTYNTAVNVSTPGSTSPQQTYFPAPVIVNNSSIRTYTNTKNVAQVRTQNSSPQQIFLPSTVGVNNTVNSSTSMNKVPTPNTSLNQPYLPNTNTSTSINQQYLLLNNNGTSAVKDNVPSTSINQQYIPLNNSGTRGRIDNVPSTSINQQYLPLNNNRTSAVKDNVPSTSINQQYLPLNNNGAGISIDNVPSTSTSINQQYIPLNNNGTRGGIDNVLSPNISINQQYLSNTIPVDNNVGTVEDIDSLQNLVSFSYTAVNEVPLSSLPGESMNNSTVLPNFSSISTSKSFMGKGPSVENQTWNANSTVSNNSLSKFQYSVERNNVVPNNINNNNVNTDNVVTRPMIRVKNICELK